MAQLVPDYTVHPCRGVHPGAAVPPARVRHDGSAVRGSRRDDSPSYAASLLLITNNTGHPSLTLRCGFRDDGTPYGITLWGGLFEDGVLCRIGMALERELDVWDHRPGLF